ncbi:MAG TPA: DUF2206 domain-containing protein [Candidatus Saccharimonadales bacterium]|nr:DUF2206 domain-containing protein [Candidatus Saccharimonadales bacterium]
MKKTQTNHIGGAKKIVSAFEITKRSELICLLLVQCLFIAGFFVGGSLFRSIGLVLLLFFPGYLLVRGLNLKQSISTKLFLSVCFSILFCYLIGLASDIFGLLFKLKQPLSADSLLVSGACGYLGLMLWRYTRPKERPVKIRLYRPGIYALTIIFFSLLSLLSCVFGAFLLNNGGSSVLMFVGYMLVGLVTLMTALGRQDKDNRIYVPILLIMSVTLIMSSAIRSRYLSGVDINAEYHLARLIQGHGYWSISLYRNAYNACLSIGLLPVVLSNLTHIGIATLIKIMLPLVFSLIALAIYGISHKFLNDGRKAFYAALFFIIQPAFFTTSLLPVRQEIALLFFAGTILVSVSFEHGLLRKVLFLALNLGMILSHYSTAYMALGLYLMVFVVSRLMTARKFESKLPAATLNLFSGRMILLLLLITFFWYSQVTIGFTNAVNFVTKSVDSIPNLLDENNQASGQSFTQQFNPLSKDTTNESQYNNYIKSLRASPDSIEPQRSDIPNVTQPRFGQPLIDSTGLVREAVKDLGKLLMAIGGIILFVRVSKRKKYDSQSVLEISAILLLGLVVVLPFASINYDYNRAYQQLLIVIAPLFILSFSVIKRMKDSGLMVAAFLALYLLLLSYAYSVPFGGADTSIAFSNNGSDYDASYTHKNDVMAASWLTLNTTGRTLVYADNYANYKINLADHASNESINTDLFNYGSTPYAYVYTDFTNNRYGISMFSYNGNLLVFKMPGNDLSATKNLVYSNGAAKIYAH